MKTAIQIIHYENEKLTNDCIQSIIDNTEMIINLKMNLHWQK